VTGSISGTTLSVPAGNSNIKVGMLVTGTGVTVTTQVTAVTNSTTFTVSPAQTVASTNTLAFAYPRFQEIAFDKAPLGPPGFDWSISSTGISFTGSIVSSSFTGSITGTTLTTTTSGAATIGMALTGTNVTPGTFVIAGSGTSYTVNFTQTTGSQTFTGTYLNVSAINTEDGYLIPGMVLTGSTVTAGTQIINSGPIVGGAAALGTGGTGNYPVSIAQNVASASLVATGTRVSSTTSGWYLMTYKLDLRTNAGSNYTYTRAATSLMIFDGTNWKDITGSSSAAQAPETVHQYSISNTVLVKYTANQLISLQWWAGYYSGTTATLQTDSVGLSVGPLNSAANERPWIPATYDPDGIPYDQYNEAVASLVITRIVDTNL
jgi:hypothetical protein